MIVRKPLIAGVLSLPGTVVGDYGDGIVRVWWDWGEITAERLSTLIIISARRRDNDTPLPTEQPPRAGVDSATERAACVCGA